MRAWFPFVVAFFSFSFVFVADTVADDRISYWESSSGSVLLLRVRNREVDVSFAVVSSAIKQRGVQAGTVVFRGRLNGTIIEGIRTVQINRSCSVDIETTLTLNIDETILQGTPNPEINPKTCRVVGPTSSSQSFRWVRRNAPRKRLEFKSVEIGKSVEVGHSVPIGQSVDIGGGVDIGQSIGIGTSVDVGTSTKLGSSVDIGRSENIGGAVEIGSSSEIGKSISGGSSVPIGNGTELGKSVEIGEAAPIGKSIEVGTSVGTGSSVVVGTSQDIGTGTEIGKSTSVPQADGTSRNNSTPYDPAIAVDETERTQLALAFDRAQLERSRLWPKANIGIGATAAELNQEKLLHDWDAINLGRAAYSNNLQIGDPAFVGRTDWIVADVRKDEKSGFLAYTFVNKKVGAAVIAIQGSGEIKQYLTNRDSSTDWNQDIQAYVLNKKPRQFDIAESYVKDIESTYGETYVVDCVGHSMGGGACAYASTRVPGVHAIALDPITYKQLRTKNAYLIDNYVLERDVADFGSQKRNRSSPGLYYKVSPPSPWLQAAPSGTANSTSPVAKEIPHTTAHNADLLLDYLASQSGLVRPQLANP